MDSGPRSHHHHPPQTHASGGREDCWSEGASEALIEAWGDRYLQLSRGNLRHKDWTEVADAVNERQEALGKTRKTDVQCKNRIDTLKKKYKVEKLKPGPSQWPLFSRLDLLIGPNSAPCLKKPNPSSVSYHKLHYPEPDAHRRPSLAFTVKNQNPNPSAAVYSDGSMNSPGSSESSRGKFGHVKEEDDEVGYEEDEDEDEDDGDNGLFEVVAARKRRRTLGTSGGGGGGEEEALGELTRAIIKFAEVYERVERSKQLQMMELERQRMKFAKDLELQRMKMFMDTQLELEKMKQPKYALGSGKSS